MNIHCEASKIFEKKSWPFKCIFETCDDIFNFLRKQKTGKSKKSIKVLLQIDDSFFNGDICVVINGEPYLYAKQKEFYELLNGIVCVVDVDHKVSETEDIKGETKGKSHVENLKGENHVEDIKGENHIESTQDNDCIIL